MPTTDGLESAGSFDSDAQNIGNAHFRQLIESFAQAVWETDATGMVVDDSPSWRAYTGQALEEWLGRGWLDAVHPDDRDRVDAGWRGAVVRGQNFDAQFRLCDAQRGWRWTNVKAIPVTGKDGNIEKWIGLNIDIDDRKLAEEAKERLQDEMRRRVRNAVGIMRSLARQTARQARNMEDFRFHLECRLAAVARTQSQISRDPLGGVDLELLIAEELLWFHAREGERLSLGGPAVAMMPNATEKIGLAIHELALHAVKTGALSNDSGKIAVRWTVADGMLEIEWTEHSAPTQKSRRRKSGLDTDVLDGILRHDLAVQSTLEHNDHGLRCVMTIADTFLLN